MVASGEENIVADLARAPGQAGPARWAGAEESAASPSRFKCFHRSRGVWPGELRRLNAPVLIESRFNAQGPACSRMGASIRSRLLAEMLSADLSGRVADFCSGCGLSFSGADWRSARVTSVDLYEADHQSLEAAAEPCRRARRNRRSSGATLSRSLSTSGTTYRHEPALSSGAGGRAGASAAS